MRRIDRKVADEEAIALLHNCEWGVLSTVDEEGQPYGVPMNYVLEGGNLYFHCSVEGGLRLSNLEKNPKACLRWWGIPRCCATNLPPVMRVSSSLAKP